MAVHDELTAYDGHAAAVTAARDAAAGKVPYRVWHCPHCGRWHTAPWQGIGAPEVSPTDQ